MRRYRGKGNVRNGNEEEGRGEQREDALKYATKLMSESREEKRENLLQEIVLSGVPFC